MKKFLGILALSAILASCGGSAENATEEAAKPADSTLNAVVDSAKSTIDSTANAVVDSAKAKVDSTVKK